MAFGPLFWFGAQSQVSFSIPVCLNFVPIWQHTGRTFFSNLQAEDWIKDKLKTANEESFGNVSDLYDKMRKLQKHQAFEAEIVANSNRIHDLGEVRCLLKD